MIKLFTSIGWQGLFMVALPLALQLTFVFFLHILVMEEQDELKGHNQSEMLISHATVFARAVLDATNNLSAYSLSGDKQFIKKFEQSKNIADSNLHPLRNKGTWSPNRRDFLIRIKMNYDKVQADWSDLLREPKSEQNREARVAHFLRARASVDQLEIVVRQYIASTQSEVKALIEFFESLRHNLRLFLSFGMAASWIVTLAVAILFGKSIADRINVLSENTHRFKTGADLLPPIGGNDEIANYDKSFRTMATDIKAAQEYKAQLLALVSHEVRTPLSSADAVIAFLLAGAAGELPEATANYLKAAETEVAHTITLVNDLIDIERLKSGQFPIRLVSLNLSEITENAAASLSEPAQAKDIEIEQAQECAALEGDADLVSRLMQNLFRHSIVSAPQGSIIHASTASKNHLTVITVDYPSEMELTGSIFEIAADNEKRGPELALCKAIAEIHGGTIGSYKPDRFTCRIEVSLPERTKQTAL